jgi:hypothetical protein
MTAIAILKFSDGTEIRTADEVCVQSLWRLMSTAVSEEDMAAVDGRTDYQPPTRLRVVQGGNVL